MKPVTMSQAVKSMLRLAVVGVTVVLIRWAPLSLVIVKRKFVETEKWYQELIVEKEGATYLVVTATVVAYVEMQFKTSDRITAI